MGVLIEGKWHFEEWPTDSLGRFQRPKSIFREKISRLSQSRFQPEANRYHLYVSLACPWAHRTLILRKLKKLEKTISLSVVDPKMGPEGWHFSNHPGCIPDPLFGAKYLREIYLQADSQLSSRVTTPVLFDKKEKTIVNNESREIMRMLDGEFDEFGDRDIDFCPADLETQVDKRIDELYEPINNGVYRCGFAKTQDAYEEAFRDLFEGLDRFEEVLKRQPFLCGNRITEADWCLFTTLVRFDLVYYFHFKCNLRRIRDYPFLFNYLNRLFQIPGVSETCDFRHIKTHYYWSHETINPHRIVPKGPPLIWDKADEAEWVQPGRYLNYHYRNGWEYVERNNCEGAVVIVPYTPEGKIILIEQYRVPLSGPVIEFPAGLVNDRHGVQEGWEEAACRELEEETGFRAQSLKFLTKGPVSPGMSNEIIAFYLAQEITKVGPGGGDGSERIRVHEVPLIEIETWLEKKSQGGYSLDPKIYTGLFFLKQVAG